MNVRLMLTTCTLAAGLAFNVAARAEEAHVHEGDILPLLVGGTIVLDDLDDKPKDFATGYAIFEADFGDFADGPNATSSPGYDHESGQFTPLTILAFKVQGPLEFWDGSTWSTSTPATITFIDALGTEVPITGTSAAGATGFIGQFDGDGNLHQHRRMNIDADAALGAYAVTVSLFGLLSDLSTPVYGESTPFMFVFNRGLAHADFEAAVDARVVPIPAAAWLLGSAVAGLGLLRRRAA